MEKKINSVGAKTAPDAVFAPLDKTRSFDKFSIDDKKGLPNNGLVANEVETIVFGNSQEMEEDELIKEMEAAQAAACAACSPSSYIYVFADVPETLVFSDSATYRLLKRSTKREFLITGKMLESRIGLNSSLYKKVLSRAVKAFRLGDDVVAFYRAAAPASTIL